MIQCVNWSEYLTEDVQKMFYEKESIVKSIEQTCAAFPEQYDCFDEYGNCIGYFRLRYGYFEVSCPDYGFNSVCVYQSKPNGYGYFTEEERAIELDNGISAIDYYYEEIVKSIDCTTINMTTEDEEDTEIYFIKHPEDTPIEEILQDLYYYQKSNMLQFEAMRIREKGPVLGFKDACMKIIKLHRLQRTKELPEANGADGISDENMEREIKFIKDSTEFMSKIDTVCWLFGKTTEDFVSIFRESCKKGWNSL